VRKKLSIVTPCFNEEKNVADCYHAVQKMMADLLPNYDYEHLFADNASTDHTLEILRQLSTTDIRLKVIVNSRNVGPFRNSFNALKSASGDAVIVLLAADLQDPPEVVAEFVRHWEDGYKIVFGIRAKREEAWWLRSIRSLYYRLVKRMANTDIPINASEFQLIDQSVARSICQVDDYYPYIRGLIAQTGLPSRGVPYTWKRRQKGKSNNNLFDLIDQGMNGLISTSAAPLRTATLFGMLTAAASLLFAISTLIINLVAPDLAPPGIATVVVGLFFFGGVQLFAIGILAEYILAIHQQLRRGPPFFETERINFKNSADNANMARRKDTQDI
jgi:polyisoprenyl-phosphate glycosyltransferase